MGASLSHSYDAAQRLVGVTDANGNAVSYTLAKHGQPGGRGDQRQLSNSGSTQRGQHINENAVH